MTEHRPECALGEDSYFNSWMIDECICDRILGCEARVLREAQLRVAAIRDPWPNTAPGTIKRSDAIAAIKSGGWRSHE
jgi:hypothetical protein